MISMSFKGSFIPFILACLLSIITQTKRGWDKSTQPRYLYECNNQSLLSGVNSLINQLSQPTLLTVTTYFSTHK